MNALSCTLIKVEPDGTGMYNVSCGGIFMGRVHGDNVRADAVALVVKATWAAVKGPVMAAAEAGSKEADFMIRSMIEKGVVSARHFPKYAFKEAA